MEKYEIIFNSSIPFNEKVEKAAQLARHEIQKNINANVKQAFKGETIWSKFINTHYKNDGAETYVFYYYGSDLGEVDLTTDWRFKKVKGKRDQAEFLGLVMMTDSFIDKPNHIKDYNTYLKIKKVL